MQEQQVQLKSGFQIEGLPVEAIGNQGAGCVPKNPIRKQNQATRFRESRTPSYNLQKLSVPGVTRDHTPDSIAQPEKPLVTIARRKDTKYFSKVSDVAEG